MLDWSLSSLRRSWQDMTAATRVRLTGNVRPDLPEDDLARIRRQIGDCLEGRGGEVSRRARAADLGRTYLNLNSEGRRRFLQLLASDYGVDQAALGTAVAAWQELEPEAGLSARFAAEARLREALTAPRVQLLAQFNELPRGVQFLVDLRAELRGLIHEDAALKGLDADLKALFISWFDPGFLELRRITWDASAALIEKLARYEAVHRIRSWRDIKHRLASDRRCYGFFHPQMPDEPLIYVWVALVKGMADNVQRLLDVRTPSDDPREADAAIFYSISNAQRGLAGVSFGNFLIKRVMNDLLKDFPRLKTFATLSPIPGLRRWFEEQREADEPLLLPAEHKSLTALEPRTGDPEATFLQQLGMDGWHRRPKVVEAVKVPLLRLGARYLTQARRGEFARDRVAHFHLSNGARMERLNWLADTSANGLEQSFGMMINYLYREDHIESNHEAYTGEGRIVMSSGVKGLARV